MNALGFLSRCCDKLTCQKQLEGERVCLVHNSGCSHSWQGGETAGAGTQVFLSCSPGHSACNGAAHIRCVFPHRSIQLESLTGVPAGQPNLDILRVLSQGFYAVSSQRTIHTVG